MLKSSFGAVPSLSKTNTAHKSQLGIAEKIEILE